MRNLNTWSLFIVKCKKCCSRFPDWNRLLPMLVICSLMWSANEHFKFNYKKLKVWKLFPPSTSEAQQLFYFWNRRRQAFSHFQFLMTELHLFLSHRNPIETVQWSKFHQFFCISFAFKRLKHDGLLDRIQKRNRQSLIRRVSDFTKNISIIVAETY